MSYKTFIEDIITTRGRFGIPDCDYKERHHITPKCLDGEDSEDNLIDLYAREHFIAHKLLLEENSDNNSLRFAYCMMAFVKDSKQQRYELTPEEYEYAKVLSSIAASIRNKSGSNHTTLGMKVYNNGKEEKFFSELETIPCGYYPGRIPFSDDHLLKLSISAKNRKSNPHTGIHTNYGSKGNIGMHWYTNGITNIQATECPDGYYLGRVVEKLLWMLPDGSTKYMDLNNAKRYHPDWTLAEATTSTVEVPVISTQKSTNYIDVETDVKPSNMSVTYRKRTK